jgi:hypothetical protein
MTVDQYLLCRYNLRDVLAALMWLRYRDPAYFQPLIVKLEQVLRVVREQPCTDATAAYGKGATR